MSEAFETELSASPGESISDLAGDTARGVYAVGTSVYRRDSSAWRRVDVPGLDRLLRAVEVAPDGHVWAVGRSGTVAHYDGASWRIEQIEAARYHDLIDVAVSGEEIWATAAGSEVYRRRSSGWEAVKPDDFAGKRAQATWGEGRRLFVEVHPERTGTGSEVALYDGDHWRLSKVGDKGYLRSIHGHSSDDVWAVGNRVKLFGKGGQAHHFDGARWSESELPLDQPLMSVYARSGTEAWAVGEEGVVLRWEGARWTLAGRLGAVTLRNVLASNGLPVLVNVEGHGIVRLK